MFTCAQSCLMANMAGFLSGVFVIAVLVAVLGEVVNEKNQLERAIESLRDPHSKN